MEALKTEIEGLLVLQREARRDDRGFFERMTGTAEMQGLGLDSRVAQVNRTLTTASGVVRGMHAQRPPAAETKVVSCLGGSVFDVALDLRVNSPTYQRWLSFTLSGAEHHSLVIPPGCAHGFQTLEPNCEMLYFHSEPYAPDLEVRLNPLDSRIGIEWPLPVSHLSAADKNAPLTTSKEYRGIEC